MCLPYDKRQTAGGVGDHGQSFRSAMLLCSFVELVSGYPIKSVVDISPNSTVVGPSYGILGG